MSNRTRCGAQLPLALLVLAAFAAMLPPRADAQTPYIPYHGKNQVRYDNFDWWTYETDHFIIYYYKEIEPHLERMASYAEAAYQHVSSELRYDLVTKIPLILFQTSSEFQQQNVIPGAAQENVGAFAEPTRHRIVMPMDEPPDLLYRLIVHELTHQFDYEIIPASLVRQSTPLWVHEGLADYMTGIWRPLDLMSVRDAAVADIIPKMSKLDGYSDVGGARMIYNLGHAIFEFIESRWGKEGLRQYLFSLRKSVIGGGEDAYEEAFKISAEEFDQQFDKYLKDRFKPFRDKERPVDYGRNLAPDPEKSHLTSALTVEPSPSGDLLAIVTGNQRDREYDIVLVSAKDGSVVSNLTKGFNQDMGFEFLTLPGGRGNAVPWMSWSAIDDRLAYFVRTEKSRTLVLQNVTTRKIEQKVDLRSVDDPESPDVSPDGKKVVFAGLRGGTGDIFMVDLATQEVTNLTNDAFADSGPTWSPDGRSVFYLVRVSGYEKLFRLDLENGRKTQITFGTHDDTSAQFLDENTIVFSSTATDPSQPIDPDVARNGLIYNVWTLNLKNGELRQYTDAVGGNVSTVAIKDGNNSKIGFVSYYKGDYELHALDRRDPIVTAASADFGSPGPIIDFQSPLSHTLVASKQKKKGTFEKMFMDGRPPVNVGVTSGGDLFGGSAVTFSDVLGDQQFTMSAASISQYRTMSFSYINLAKRFNYAVQGYSQTQFFYGQLENVFYDPYYNGLIDRDLATATRTIRGATAFGIFPFNRYNRVEVFGGFLNYNESFNEPGLQEYSQDYQEQQFGRQLLQSGNYVPLGVAYVSETTVFREFGPLSGSTMRLSYENAPKIGNTLSRQTLDLDARKYIRLGASGLLALRARGFKSWGDSPDFMYFGGNSEMRGYEYLQFVGDTSAFFNAELRFPFIEAMLTPVGVLGGIRGVLFANMGGGHFNGQPFKWWTRSDELVAPIIGYDTTSPPTGTSGGQATPIFGPQFAVDGFRLVDARASYGIGLETFALGFPIHFDWAWKTLFNKDYERIKFFNYLNPSEDGSEAFRKVKFSVWIGYDF
jgi:hypothetical protein